MPSWMSWYTSPGKMGHSEYLKVLTKLGCCMLMLIAASVTWESVVKTPRYVSSTKNCNRLPKYITHAWHGTPTAMLSVRRFLFTDEGMMMQFTATISPLHMPRYTLPNCTKVANCESNTCIYSGDHLAKLPTDPSPIFSNMTGRSSSASGFKAASERSGFNSNCTDLIRSTWMGKYSVHSSFHIPGISPMTVHGEFGKNPGSIIIDLNAIYNLTMEVCMEIQGQVVDNDSHCISPAPYTHLTLPTNREV